MKNKIEILTILNLFLFLGIGIFVIYNVTDRYEHVISSQQIELRIKTDMLTDMTNYATAQRNIAYDSEQSGYTRGFEAGRTQAATVLMGDESIYEYRDGYHAALSQFAPDVSESGLNMFIRMYQDALVDGNPEEAKQLVDLIIEQIAIDIDTSEINELLQSTR